MSQFDLTDDQRLHNPTGGRKPMSRKLLRLAGSLLLVCVWLTSLFLPVASAQTINEPRLIIDGLDVLKQGWLAVIWGQIAWLANVTFFGLLLIAVFVRDLSPRVLFVIAVLHLVFTLSAFGWTDYPSNEGMPESNNLGRMYVGYYAWLCCMFAAPALAFSTANFWSFSSDD